ncbi:hypothetical protein HMI56_004302 [Coelomomyces lativittatus]|nr:hypothetical protein HMI56_004302 [Coelomomyces lativittatus]
MADVMSIIPLFCSGQPICNLLHNMSIATEEVIGGTVIKIFGNVTGFLFLKYDTLVIE